MRRPSNLWALLGALVSLFSAAPALAQSAAVQLALLQQAPYPGATVALDFIGSATNGQPYCRVGGSAAPCSSLLTTTRASIGYGECNGQLILFQANQPRITCQGLLVEEARTNMFLQSQTFTNAAWSQLQATVTGAAATAPDGTLTAAKIVEDTSNNFHGVRQGVTVVNATAYAYAVYLKAAERTWAYLERDDVGTGSAYVNLSTCAVGTTSGLASAVAATSVNGWCRLTLNRTTDGTGATYYITTATSDGGKTYTGNGSSGIYVWQADLQAGSFITSPILTTSASATRAADSVSIGSWVNPTTGTAFAQFQGSPNTGAPRVIGGNNSRALIYQNGPLGVGTYDGTTTLTEAATVTGRVKAAMAWTSASRLLTANGLASVSDANSTGAITTLYLGSDGGAGQFIDNYIEKIVVYPTNYTNAQLRAATQ